MNRALKAKDVDKTEQVYEIFLAGNCGNQFF